MHLKSDNIEIMNYDKADEVIEEVFESLLNRYQIGFKISIKGSTNKTLVMLICCITNAI